MRSVFFQSVNAGRHLRQVGSHLTLNLPKPRDHFLHGLLVLEDADDVLYGNEGLHVVMELSSLLFRRDSIETLPPLVG